MELWSGDVRLEGTLSVPDDPGPHPAALLLSGSGPLDRDSNMSGTAPRRRQGAGHRLGRARCRLAALRQAWRRQVRRRVPHSEPVRRDRRCQLCTRRSASATREHRQRRRDRPLRGRHRGDAAGARRPASGRLCVSGGRGHPGRASDGLAVATHRGDPAGAVAMVPAHARAAAGRRPRPAARLDRRHPPACAARTCRRTGSASTWPTTPPPTSPPSTDPFWR